MAASTAVADSRKKTAGGVQMVERPKSPTPPRGASARPGTQHRRSQQQPQQQQNFTEAAEMLKRVANKQLTGSSMAERMLAEKLSTLPDNKSQGLKAAAKD